MSKIREEGLKISILDLATMLFHVHRGAQLPDEVGFEDAGRSLRDLTEEMSPIRARVPFGSIESALWSCNLMDEASEWWSPTGETFDDFLTRVLRYASDEQKLEFDKRFNLLAKKEK